MGNLPSKILVVDDDPAVANGIIEGLSSYSITTLKALDLETALYHFNQNRMDVVLVELEFGPLPGLALIQKWRKHEMQEKRLTSFIVMSGLQRNQNDSNLIKEMGELEIINKPFTTIQVLPYLSRAQAARQRAENFHNLKSKVLDFYTSAGNFEKAIEVVKKKSSELGAKSVEVMLDLYLKAERHEEALTLVDQLLSKDPNDISLINTKASLLLKLGRLEDACNAFEKADKAAPKNIERINNMATLYLELKQPKNSVKKFQEMVDLNPEDPDLKFTVFSKLFDHGYDKEAEEFGKKNAKPMEIVRHYNNKGVLLSKSGKTDEAISEYQNALKFFPKFKENYRIYYNLGLAFTSKKSRPAYEEAREYLTKCLELSPKFEKAQKTLNQVNSALDKKKPKKAAG